MAIVTTDNQHYTDIANAIREKTEGTDGIKPEEMPEKIVEVYDAGKEARDAEWWDKYLFKTDNYRYFFAGYGWNQQTFMPIGTLKKSIVSALCMFESHNTNSPIYDLVERLEEQNFVIDFSTAKSMQSCFAYANVSRVGVIDLTSVSSSSNSGSMFSSCKIATIDELVFNEKTFDWANTMFSNASELKNLTASGVLANTINFQWCPLTPASMKSIISILKNFTGTGNEYSKSITFNDDCWTALEADSTAPDGGTWANYVFNLGWNT